MAVDTDVLGIDRVRASHYYREVAATVAGRHSLMAYVPWRGRIVAAIMLGRSGSTFSRDDLQRVESALPALGVARAAFGLPCHVDPLAANGPGPLARWLGLAERERVLASMPGSRETLVVRDRAGFREMVASGAGEELVWTRAALRDPRESGWHYVDLFHLAAALAKQRRRALFIGCGGAVALRQFASVYPGIAIDVVERDPAVIELARRWFDLDTIPGTTVHIEDGAVFVARAAAGSWDVVVVDAYGAAAFDSPFATPEFFSNLRRAIDPGGAAALNVIGTLGARGPVRDVAQRALREFASIRLLPVVTPEESCAADTARNVVIVALGTK